MTAKDRLNRLKTLAAQAGPALYERIKLATALLDDRDYVAGAHDGDQAAAAEFLQVTYFADIGGLIGVITLADIFRTFPNESKWQEHRYDLQRMRAAWWEATHPATERKPRAAATVAMIEERDEKIKRQQEQLVAADARIAEVSYTLKREKENREYLAERVNVLERENAELRGELRAMKAAMRREEVAA